MCISVYIQKSYLSELTNLSFCVNITVKLVIADGFFPVPIPRSTGSDVPLVPVTAQFEAFFSCLNCTIRANLHLITYMYVGATPTFVPATFEK